MKMAEALACINAREGYCVTFEIRKDSCLHSDHFPDVRAGEPGIETIEAAWDLAAKFAYARRKDVVNVFVVHASDFTPIEGSLTRALNLHPARSR
jgi:1,2-phenylacetyl-CoA epoxidase PaaB subunit